MTNETTRATTAKLDALAAQQEDAKAPPLAGSQVSPSMALPSRTRSEWEPDVHAQLAALRDWDEY